MSGTSHRGLQKVVGAAHDFLGLLRRLISIHPPLFPD